MISQLADLILSCTKRYGTVISRYGVRDAPKWYVPTSHGIAVLTWFNVKDGFSVMSWFSSLGVKRNSIPIFLSEVPDVVEVPNRAGAMDARARSACYPRGSFYPLSPVSPTKHTKITMTDFRRCSACWPHSQASICHCTSSPVSNRAKDTFVRLRYFLASNLPS